MFNSTAQQCVAASAVAESARPYSAQTTCHNAPPWIADELAESRPWLISNVSSPISTRASLLFHSDWKLHQRSVSLCSISYLITGFRKGFRLWCETVSHAALKLMNLLKTSNKIAESWRTFLISELIKLIGLVDFRGRCGQPSRAYSWLTCRNLLVAPNKCISLPKSVLSRLP